MTKLFYNELKKIFGEKFEGCTQEGDELIEYRLRPGQVATSAELAQMAELIPDWKAEWLSASTTAAKLKVLARERKWE